MIYIPQSAQGLSVSFLSSHPKNTNIKNIYNGWILGIFKTKDNYQRRKYDFVFYGKEIV